MTFSADNFLSNSIHKRQEQNALRKLVIKNQLSDFCSNDYLGFASSKELLDSSELEISNLPLPCIPEAYTKHEQQLNPRFSRATVEVDGKELEVSLEKIFVDETKVAGINQAQIMANPTFLKIF